MEGPERDVHQRILMTAESLFAEIGYDETTLQMIADAVGLPLSFVTGEFGDKGHLYTAVMQGVRDRGEEVMKKHLESCGHDAASLHLLADSALDHFLQYPQDAALWMQLRMQDAADLADVGRRSSFSQLTRTLELMGGGLRQELDPVLVLETIFWSVQCFIRDGVFDETGFRVGREDPGTVDRFRRHLHQMVDCFTAGTAPGR